MKGATSRAWVGLLGVLLVGAGCAGSPILRVEGGYRHHRHDYTIAKPGGPGEAWQRVRLDDAALAFRRPGPESISLQSRCGRPVAPAAFMARHLVIGLPDRTPIAEGPIQVAGREGWTQTFDTVKDGVSVRVKTVTLVVADCSFDWILATPAAFEPAEQAFDAWWSSFRLDPRYDQAADGGTGVDGGT
jgi:hypothetical protein